MSWKSQSTFGVLATLAALLVYINATHSEYRVSYRPQYNQPSRTNIKQRLLEEMLRELISAQDQKVEVNEHDNGDDRYQGSQNFGDINALKNTLSTIDEKIAISSASTGCPGSPQHLITGNRFRVEDYQFTASSSWSATSYIPRDARIGGISWCSASGQGANSWIQVDFGVNVIISEVLVGGYPGWYLKTFRIEYGPNDNQLSPVLQPGSTRPMLFATGNTHIVKSFALPAPITTRVLRIRTVTHTLSAPCVHLEANGCPQLQGCEKDQKLSTNRSLLPLSSIKSSLHTPAGEVTTTDWCSSEPFQSTGPYIVFNFKRSVVLTYMTARGRSSQYVKQFSLDYKRDYSDEYTTYTLLNNKEAIFTSKGSELQTYTFWKQPLEGVSFRFRIRDGQRSGGEFCWNVQLYGCTGKGQDTEIQPTYTTGCIPYIRIHSKAGTDSDATQLKKDGSNIKLILITEDGSYSAEHKKDEYLKLLRSLLNKG